MGGLVRPLFAEPARHVYRLLSERHYLTYHRLVTQLRHVPRFARCRARLHGWQLELPDAASFLSTYRELFVNQVYAFACVGQVPRILDLGANIGLSVLFFKHTYPEAQITALEPDPSIFPFLERNVHGNGFTDVTLVNKAAWCEDTTLSFRSEGGDGGQVIEGQGASVVPVEAVDVRRLLSQNVFDLIKMDIEGAEKVVLPACRSLLAETRWVFVEYHSRIVEPQQLAELLSILEESGFRVSIEDVWMNSPPFIGEGANSLGFDYQGNIFASRR